MLESSNLIVVLIFRGKYVLSQLFLNLTAEALRTQRFFLFKTNRETTIGFKNMLYMTDRPASAG